MARIHCANAQSTATSFIQLARRSYTTAPQTSTPLEFLIPRYTLSSRRRNPQITIAQSRTYAHLRRSWDLKSKGTATRQFSTTTIRQKTRAILNPQQDEDGNEMMLEITERAAKVIVRRETLLETLLTLKASQQDHGKGWQPEPRTKDSS
jgi:iron-sulfur cluster assembly 2